MCAARQLIEALVNPDEKVKFKARLGRCYELAGRLASHNEDVTLVHGSIQGFGSPRIDHAWVELPDGNVWEPASNQTLDRYVFDQVWHPVAKQKYDHEQVLVNSLKTAHWGPWDGSVTGQPQGR